MKDKERSLGNTVVLEIYCFQGLAIGNGLIDPLSMLHYTEFCRILGLLEQRELEVLKTIEDSAIEAIKKEKMLDAALVRTTLIGNQQNTV